MEGKPVKRETCDALKLPNKKTILIILVNTDRLGKNKYRMKWFQSPSLLLDLQNLYTINEIIPHTSESTIFETMQIANPGTRFSQHGDFSQLLGRSPGRDRSRDRNRRRAR